MRKYTYVPLSLELARLPRAEEVGAASEDDDASPATVEDDAPALRTPCELARFAAARSAPTALVLARAEARRFALASGP
jgi:hypothetical protein